MPSVFGLQDVVIEHSLPLFDCHGDASSSEGLTSDHGIRDLKEKLSKYNIDGSMSDTSRFIEYWVPVQISNAQLQYCATLLSNSLLLSSSNSKNDLVGSFRDIVILNRKVSLVFRFHDIFLVALTFLSF